MSTPKKTRVSVVIPTYNEEKTISSCLSSLKQQTLEGLEVIVVDDSSTDGTVSVLRTIARTFAPNVLRFYKQRHHGPGVARNFGADKAKGTILVFVDADMIFSKGFVKRLVNPIKLGKTIGTNSHDEYLMNPENFWARCWNMAKFAAAGNFSNRYLIDIIPNKRDRGGVFRAILKSKFNEVRGFDLDGDYTDDTSLARKLGTKAKVVRAKFYHYNPGSLSEVWQRAKWIGQGKQFTNGKAKKLINFVKFFPTVSLLKAIIISFRFRYVPFIPFKMIYDIAIFISVVRSAL